MKRIGIWLLVTSLLLGSLCGCRAQPDPVVEFLSVSIQADSLFYYQGTPNYQLAVIERDGKYGLVDFEGNIVTPIEYPPISLRETYPHSPDTKLMAYEFLDNEPAKAWHFNADGTVINAEYDAWGYTDGYDVYWYGDKPVLSYHDEWLEPFTYEDYVAKTDPRHSFDTYILEPASVLPVRSILSVNETTEPMESVIAELSDKYALLDTKKQRLITDFIYEDYSRVGFVDGVAAVKKDGKWGYIRENGTAVTEFIYDAVTTDQYTGSYLYSATNGYIVVCRDNKYGIIRKDGKVVLEPIYEDVTAVTDKGLFWLKKDDVWFVGKIR